ncbi:MAG: hypothetical protein R3C40_08400 [Parvularculaceae bacterium]
MNSLTGGGGGDRLKGDAGDDTLNGRFGDDTVSGGAGDDLFEFRQGHGNDVIDDFTAGAASEDVVRLIGFGAAFDSFAEVLAASSQIGANVVIDFGGGDSITLEEHHARQIACRRFHLRVKACAAGAGRGACAYCLQAMCCARAPAVSPLACGSRYWRKAALTN